MMKLMIVIALLSTALGLIGDRNPASADDVQVLQIQEAFKKCAALKNIQRLQCYDQIAAIFGILQPSPTIAQDPKYGDWMVQDTVSPVTEKRSIIMAVNGAASVGIRPTLIVRCDDLSTSVEFHFGGRPISHAGRSPKVSYRVDSQEPKDMEFHRSEDEDASTIGLWSAVDAVPFLSEIFNGNELHVRTLSAKGILIETTLPIEGMSEAIKPLRAACKW